MVIKKHQLIQASAPGSTMLLGEYAVLHNGNALVCAVEKRISVRLVPRTDDQIELISVLGKLQISLAKMEVIAPFQFVLATLLKYKENLKHGCTITMDSEFSDQMGLGSSAAVTVATVAVLTAWLELSYTSLELIDHARSIIRSVQGLGSGADIAACVLGGVVAYCQQPLIAERIDFCCPLTLIYSGSKTPTAIAVKRVEKNFSNQPEQYQQLLQAIDGCAQRGIVAARHNDIALLGQAMSEQQHLMNKLGVNTLSLQSIIEKLTTEAAIGGAKISGSGLGDCVVALGSLSQQYQSPPGTQPIPIKIASQGVLCEKI